MPKFRFFGKPSSLCLSLAVIVCSAVQAFAQPRSTAERKAPPVLESIDAALKAFVDQGKIAGAVSLVGHEGKVVHLSHVGMADIEAERPMTNQTLFSIASMTKPIVATGVLILQDEGKLNVSDKVSQYLPAFAKVRLADGAAPQREITIRDVLTHTAGLDGNQIFDGSLAAAVDELAHRPLAFEPGEQWKYSPGINVAGRIIEIVSEQPLDKFLQKRIFEPLGMNNTTFTPNPRQQQRLARIYAPGDEPGSLTAVDNHITSASAAPNPSGGLYSTARDLFRFYQMVLNGGQLRQVRVLSEAAVRHMRTPQTGDLQTGFTPGNCWGLGWCIVREPQGVTGMLSPQTFGHGGAFGTQGWVDPETQTIYVLLIQRTKFGNADGSDIREEFQQAAGAALSLH